MELKANELRLNNWVYAFKTTYQIDVNDFDQDKVNTYQPIPLTEEWLLKCSFNFCNYGYEFSVSNHILSGNFFFMISGYAKQIYYLHELQNLYFALTNKELEIKM